MDYSIDDLTTIEECNEALELVELEKADQDYRIRQMEKKHATAVKDGPTIELDIVTATDSIAGLETLVASLPEGEAKKQWEGELSKAKLNLQSLLKSRENYGVLSKLKYEFTFNCLTKSLAELLIFITAVEAKKATL